MTLPDDERVIEADAPQYNATLVRRVDHTHDLAYVWVKFDGEPVPFEPGQYMTIGVVADGKLWQRPYSVASAPRESGDGGYEFYVRLVPIIRFTTLLWRLPVGQRMRMIGPKGKFLLEPNDDRTHLFISTGTGLAPFVSMIRQTLARWPAAQDGRPARLLVRGRTRLPCRTRGLAGRRHVSGHLRPHHQPPCTIPAMPAGPGGLAASSRWSGACARTSTCGPIRRSSTSAATPT